MKAFVYKALCVAYGIGISAICLHLGCIQLTHTFTPTHDSHHTRRSRRHPCHRRIHVHINTCLFHCHHAWKLLTRAGHSDARPRSTRLHLRTHTPSPAGSWQAGWCPCGQAEQGVFSTPLFSLACSTCPDFSSLHSCFDWVECQSLPGTEPRAAAQKQLSSGNAAL